MDFESYAIESARTASGEFHKEVVSDILLESALADAIRQGSILDQIKKGLFYGKPLDGSKVKTEGLPGNLDSSRIYPELLHAVLGVLTESVEILEVLTKAMAGKTLGLDRVHMIEELGDIEWYMAMFYRALHTNPEHVREVNIAKLKARYPEKFTGHDAVNRDMALERSVLEKATLK